MAGAGKKTFTAGETLTASDVNTYLMEQSVMVFGGTAARSSAIPTPSEGMFAVTTNDDELDYYNGSAWVTAVQIGAWTSYTPTVSTATGSITSQTLNQAKYVVIGKLVSLFFDLTITTNGTGGGKLSFTLPAAAQAKNAFYIGSGRENAVSGNMLQVVLETTSSASVFTYNNLYPGVNNARILASITYEMA
jgi:hypothetical protein